MNTIELGADSGSFYAIIRFDGYVVEKSDVLVVRYDFENGTAEDVSGNGNNGTIIGTAGKVTGRYGYGIDLADAYITVDVNLNTTWTAWMWAKTGSEWHNYVFLFNGTSIVKEYMDLVEGDYFNIVSYNGSTVTIAETFSGVIDEFRIYNRSLSTSELYRMYEALRLKFYDESNGVKIKGIAKIYDRNGAYTLQVLSDDVTKEGVLFNDNLPQKGEWLLTASSTNYGTRNLILELDNYVEKNVYLPPTSTTVINVIRVYDSTGKFYTDTKVRLQKGGEVIEEQYLSPEHTAGVYFLKDAYYSLYLDNGEEIRSIGLVKYDPDGYLDIYLTTISIKPVSYANVIYEIERGENEIVCEYSTLSGTTSYVEFEVLFMNGTQAYFANADTGRGKFVYVVDANETYKVRFYAVNSLGNVSFTTVSYPLSVQAGVIAGPGSELSVSIQKYDIKELPEWVRALFLGGLVIFTTFLFKRSHVPIGLMISLAMLITFTHLQYLSIQMSLIWVLAIITMLAFFERRRDK